VRWSVLGLALFLSSGLLIEGALGNRIEAYVNDDLLREFVRLGHAHGGLLFLVNLGMAVASRELETPDAWARPARWAGLIGAMLVGVGFASAGIWHGPTDPGPTVLLVPAGALALIAALVVVALVRPGDSPPPGAA
jgi:hypothetical protein